MNNLAINSKNYNRYLNVCRKKCVFIYSNNDLDFQIDIRKFNFYFEDDFLVMGDLENEAIDMRIKTEDILCMEFCKLCNQLIIELVSGNHVTIDIV